MIRKCNFSIYKLRQIRNMIPRKTLIAMVQSEVMSKIDYGNALLIFQPKYSLKRIQTVINRAVRLIFKIPKRASVRYYTEEILHWLPIAGRIDFKTLLIIHKAIKYNKPTYISSYFYRIQKTTRNNCFQPRTNNKKFSIRALKYCGPALLNRLPNAIANEQNTTTFKRLVKTHLYKNAFDRPLDSLLQ